MLAAPTDTIVSQAPWVDHRAQPHKALLITGLCSGPIGFPVVVSGEDPGADVTGCAQDRGGIGCAVTA
jgi:hypothetical protein